MKDQKRNNLSKNKVKRGNRLKITKEICFLNLLFSYKRYFPLSVKNQGSLL